MNKKVTFWLRVVISATILGYLIWRTGVESLLGTLSEMKALYIIPIFFLLLVVLPAIRTFSYAVLLKNASKQLPFWKVFAVNYYSWALGMIMPGGKVGEMSAAYFLKKEGLNASESIELTIIDKAISFLVVSMIAAVGVAKFIGIQESLVLIAVSIAFLVLVAAAIFIEIRKKFFAGTIKKILNRVGMEGVVASSLFRTTLKKGKRYIFANFLLTVTGSLAAAVMFWLAFLAFGESVSITNVLLINSAGTLLSLLPISIGGLGVRETSAVILFSRIGVESSVTLSAHLVVVFVTYIVLFLILAYYNAASMRKR
ncbi:flippase-like domain-containing protein [Candidatus Woesearchaeota archaeon]|nr:flippase-like domain-containing protein [Candidatus Woesearchaeota archaeon]